MMTFQGGMVFGSILWGTIAEHTSTPIALATAAAGGLLADFSVCAEVPHFARTAAGPTYAHQFKRPAPQLALNTEPTDGPVRISIEYCIPAENYADFTRAIHQLRGVRLRDGAILWGIYRDALDPGASERDVSDGVLAGLSAGRRERITAADEAIRARVRALHQHDDPPKTTYQIYAKEIANPVPSHVTEGVTDPSE